MKLYKVVKQLYTTRRRINLVRNISKEIILKI